MKTSRALSFLLVACASSVAACGGQGQGSQDPIDLPVPDAGPMAMAGSDGSPPAGANGKRPSCFWDHGSQQALRTLGGAALRQAGDSIPTIPLTLVPESCREVIQNAVECALPQGQVLRDPVTGGSYQGWWGLAPSWSTDALSAGGRRDVTACMIQRLNFTATPVPILLEGPNPAIVVSSTYDSLYPIEESTAFGDLFSSTTPLFSGLPAFDAYVCWEDVLPQSCGMLGLPLLFENRICDDVPLCGLTTLGPCSLNCVHDGPYWKCKPTALSLSYWTQTVRVQLETADCN